MEIFQDGEALMAYRSNEVALDRVEGFSIRIGAARETAGGAGTAGYRLRRLIGLG